MQQTVYRRLIVPTWHPWIASLNICGRAQIRFLVQVKTWTLHSFSLDSLQRRSSSIVTMRINSNTGETNFLFVMFVWWVEFLILKVVVFLRVGYESRGAWKMNVDQQLLEDGKLKWTMEWERVFGSHALNFAGLCWNSLVVRIRVYKTFPLSKLSFSLLDSSMFQLIYVLYTSIADDQIPFGS